MKFEAYTRAKMDAGNGSNGTCLVIDVSRSPPPEPSRWLPRLSLPLLCTHRDSLVLGACQGVLFCTMLLPHGHAAHSR